MNSKIKFKYQTKYYEIQTSFARNFINLIFDALRSSEIIVTLGKSLGNID